MSNEVTKIPRPGSVMLVSALVLLEALSVLAYAISYAIHFSEDGVLNLGGRLFMFVLCLLAAIWQGSVAINFYKGKAFTRAPIILWQLFQLILSVSFFSSGVPLVVGLAVAAVVVAGAAIIFLFAPKTTGFLGDRPTT